MTLARDANVTVLPLLDEDEETYSFPSSTAAASETGYAYGRPLPTMPGAPDAPVYYGKRIVAFDGLSQDEDIYPSTTLRTLLNYFYAGGSIRVYRNYPTVLTEWGAANQQGYDDITPAEEGGSQGYPWFGASSFRRYTFRLEGVVENNR